MSDKRLEILPYGQTLEQHEALQAKKARGAAGARGCLWIGVVFTWICLLSILAIS